MPQTVNGENTENGTEKTPKPFQRAVRPGQRQQERLQRVARRQKRRRIWGASILAVLIIALAIFGDVELNNYHAAQAQAASNAQATSIARDNATATAVANATATVVTKNCFVDASAPAVPSIYTASTTPAAGPKTAPEISGTPVTTKDGLKYIDMKVGTGAEAATGKTVTVNYTGWLANGCTEFDSSYDSHSDSQTGQTQPAQPATFQLAQGSVIQGWVEGVAGMKVGGIRRVYIPAVLGYGAQGNGPVPANADLIFDVQLLSVGN